MTCCVRLFGSLAVLLLVAGCGGDSGPPKLTVEGEVTFEGEPIESGSITFAPTDGKGSTAGGKIENGRYSLEISAGEKRVSISGERKTGKVERRDPDDPSTEYELTEQFLPTAYNADSKLVVTVGPDQKEHDFALDAKGTVPQTDE